MISDNSNFKIEKTNIKTAQEFWDSSPEATFFTNPFVISKIEKNLDFWIVQKGNENICLWPICKNSENRTFIPVFFYYFGPFCSNYYYKISNHSKFLLQLKVLDLFVDRFEKSYKNISTQLHYLHHDLRYFIWKKNKKNNYFSIYPKYSASITEIDKKNEKEIISNFSELRRRMLKKSIKSNIFEKTKEFEKKEVIDLYKDTIIRKNPKINKKHLNDALEKISIFFSFFKKEKNLISFNGYRNKKNQKLISLIMLGHTKSISNLILNLSHKDWQKTGITALTMLDSIKLSQEMNMKDFDFNGANSFVGSDDKHHYGSNYRMYFEINSN